MKKTVLITGAGGVIGSLLRKSLADTYQIRSLAHRPIEGVETIVADIRDMEAMVAACQGVDSIVHMAASASFLSPWEEVLQNNIIGTYTVYEAAHRADVKQVVFASSNHAVGTYEQAFQPGPGRPNEKVIDHLVPVRPDSLYGVSKCFGEALGRYYADHQGMRVICIRIGSITKTDQPNVKGSLAEPGVTMWQSERDFAQMVERCLEADSIKFDIFYGVSGNPFNFFDLSHAKEVLGYQPQDSSFEKVQQS